MQSDQAIQVQLVSSLQIPEAYPHPVERVSHLETHISHVLLAGEYVYKLKKPVDLGFLDFSTLELRRRFCEEELRLNRRLAPDIYLGVVPITGSVEQPVLGGAGPVIEYVVKMRRFPQSALLTQRPLNGVLMTRIAARLAAFHGGIDAAEPWTSWGRAEQVCKPMLENFEQIRRWLAAPERSPHFDLLEHWTRSRCARLHTVLTGRKREGFVRECHGDLHLGNMALVEERLVIFDGIEFSEPLRWIDTMSDVAFLFMDLVHRGEAPLAWRFLNVYLELSGDYSGVEVLGLYLVYRAMVRAKVAAIRRGQQAVTGPEAEALYGEYLGYIELADSLSRHSAGGVIITVGVSGVGKSTLTQPLLERLPALRLRSDVERKRLFGLAPNALTGAGQDRGIYQPEATEATYERLLDLARLLTGAGYTVIVDATFLKRRHRAPFQEYAGRNGLPFLILAMEAPPEVLRERIMKRKREGRDASEADLAVLESQLAAQEPLSAEEAAAALELNSAKTLPIELISERWGQLTGA